MIFRRSIAAALLALGCAACAGTPPVPEVPPKRPWSAVGEPGEVASQIPDPIEGWNRGVYKFNAQADRYVLLPVVDAYRFVTPKFVRDRIHDFFSNLSEVTTFANAALQFKAESAGRAAVRFVNNVMFGFGGLYDITAANGIFQVKEDFGQTLGYWGVGEDPTSSCRCWALRTFATPPASWSTTWASAFSCPPASAAARPTSPPPMACSRSTSATAFRSATTAAGRHSNTNSSGSSTLDIEMPRSRDSALEPNALTRPPRERNASSKKHAQKKQAGAHLVLQMPPLANTPTRSRLSTANPASLRIAVRSKPASAR